MGVNGSHRNKSVEEAFTCDYVLDGYIESPREHGCGTE